MQGYDHVANSMVCPVRPAKQPKAAKPVTWPSCPINGHNSSPAQRLGLTAQEWAERKADWAKEAFLHGEASADSLVRRQLRQEELTRTYGRVFQPGRKVTFYSDGRVEVGKADSYLPSEPIAKPRPVKVWVKPPVPKLVQPTFGPRLPKPTTRLEVKAIRAERFWFQRMEEIAAENAAGLLSLRGAETHQLRLGLTAWNVYAVQGGTVTLTK